MAQIQIPNPLPTNHQDLLDVFFAAGAALNEGKGPEAKQATRSEISCLMPARVNMAVFMASMDYQVENGGWKQWMDNGYSGDGVALLPLFRTAADLGIENADKVRDVLEAALAEIKDFKASGKSDWGWVSLDDDDNDVIRTLCDSEDAIYYAIPDRNRLFQAILGRFDEISEKTLRDFFGDDRKAA